MKNLLKLLSLFLVSALLFACKTKDPNPDDNQLDLTQYYEVPDAAFADYLVYNTTRTDDNAIPANIMLKHEGKIYIHKTNAAGAGILYLVKDSKRVTALTDAGVATAAQKITNLDGIQFFTGVVEMKLTSNDIVGKLDLSPLTKLEVLEMNSNYVNELIVPASVTRLRYAASSSATAEQKLTAIDLTANSNLDHMHLPNHLITVEGLKFPIDYSKLTYVDVSGNPDAPFTVSEEFFNQLQTAAGLVPEVVAKFYVIPDAAFADYLYYNSTLADTDNNKLPAGIIIEEDGVKKLDQTLALSVTNLYLVKDKTRVTNLEAAGVPTAAKKISNLDGIQHFTNVVEMKLTSNEIVGKLDLSPLTKLEVLEMNSNWVDELIVPASVTRLRYAASSSSSAPESSKLTAIDVSANSNLDHLHLPKHNITKEGLKLPTDYSKLTYIDVSGNVGEPFTVPAALFAQLTTAKGVVSE